MTDNNENEEEDNSTDDTGEGDNSQANDLIKQTNAATERLEKANEEAERINAETKARIALGGTADAGGIEQTPTKLNDIEYAEACQRGEVNPMKEDGFK